jgi:hypothetical protein
MGEPCHPATRAKNVGHKLEERHCFHYHWQQGQEGGRKLLSANVMLATNASA